MFFREISWYSTPADTGIAQHVHRLSGPEYLNFACGSLKGLPVYMIYHLMLCLGDSLTCGARDRFGRNYPLELARALSGTTGDEWYCITEAFSGRTSSDLAREVYPVVQRYADVYGAIVLIGTNDSRQKVPADIFLDNVRQIVRVCRILKKRVFVLSVPRFTPERHFLWYDHDALALVEEYNAALSRLPGASYVDISQVITDDDLIDGVHFSHEGNLKLADFLAQYLVTEGARPALGVEVVG
jgi:lysophospholipase L1-like esterase